MRRLGLGWASVVLLSAGMGSVQASSLDGLGQGLFGGTSKPRRDVVLPLDATVDGKGYPELTAQWWQWAMSAPAAPSVDRDGRACGLAQSGPVWFLAGTDGSFDARRTCQVPAGKYILLPVINMVQHTPRGVAASDCSEMQARVASINDRLGSAVVFIDGMMVKDTRDYRVRSNGCFAVSPRGEGDARHGASIAASEGYWLLIKPLPPGRHTITVGASYGADRDGEHALVQNFEYRLDVGGQVGVAAR